MFTRKSTRQQSFQDEKDELNEPLGLTPTELEHIKGTHQRDALTARTNRRLGLLNS